MARRVRRASTPPIAPDPAALAAGIITQAVDRGPLDFIMDDDMSWRELVDAVDYPPARVDRLSDRQRAAVREALYATLSQEQGIQLGRLLDDNFSRLNTERIAAFMLGQQYARLVPAFTPAAEAITRSHAGSGRRKTGGA